ncbi:MAG: ATP-binding protein [Phycisphaerales bacterium]
MVWILIALAAGMVVGGAAAFMYAARRVRVSIARVHKAQKRAQAAERLAEIGSMTGGLAHEIKNPLSTIGLNAQLLTEAIEDLPIESAERSRLVRRIEALGRETERLRGILEDFLEYAGELRLSIQQENINTIVEELADFFSPMADGAGVRLRVETDPGSPVARVDANHLKQALLNLMLNALHAMERHQGEARELIVRVVRDADEQGQPLVRLHVIDTGPGIDEQTRAKIFHPYFTTKSGGNGLGLPTARRIIEAHHGDIDLHSELGRGSDFVITLPAGDRDERGDGAEFSEPGRG